MSQPEIDFNLLWVNEPGMDFVRAGRFVRELSSVRSLTSKELVFLTHKVRRRFIAHAGETITVSSGLGLDCSDHEDLTLPEEFTATRDISITSEFKGTAITNARTAKDGRLDYLDLFMRTPAINELGKLNQLWIPSEHITEIEFTGENPRYN